MKSKLFPTAALLTLTLVSLASAQSAPSATLRLASLGDQAHRSALSLEIDGLTAIRAQKVDAVSPSLLVTPGKHRLNVYWNDGSSASQTLTLNAVAGQLSTVLVDSTPDPVRGPAITVFQEGAPTPVASGQQRMRSYDATGDTLSLPAQGVQTLAPGQQQTVVRPLVSGPAYRSAFAVPQVGGVGRVNVVMLTDTYPY